MPTTRRSRSDETMTHRSPIRVPLRFAAVALVVAVALIAARTWAQRASPQPAPANFDLRTEKAEKGEATTPYLSRFALDPLTAAGLANTRSAGLARLRSDFVGVDVDDSPELGTPEIVSAAIGGRLFNQPTDDRAGAMRAFLSTYADAYGLTPQDVASLEVVADYMNPAGNMAWVELEQHINGLPVFRGMIRGGFTAKGELARTTGALATGVDAAALSSSPSLSAADAVSRAAANVGWRVAIGGLAYRSSGGDRFTFARGSMAAEARASLLYFPLAPGVARLAWAAEIWGDPDVFLIVLDAEDGTVLFRKNLTEYQTQSATYVVYNNDSPAPSSPSPAIPGAGYQAPYIGRTMFTLIGNEAPNIFNNLGWMTDGANITDGNNVEAGIDRDGVNGVDAPVAGVPNRVFNFAYNPETDSPLTVGYQQGDVTNMFYWVNRYHDSTYLLGFNEVARNFQHDNFGRGGAGADRISAEGQDSSGANNANFSAPADGGRGRMQMFIWTGPTPDRSGDLDQDVIYHELTHGTSNRLHGNSSGLTTNMARGMGEGWSDFCARSLLATAGEDHLGVFTIGGWVTNAIAAGFVDNYYYGIRRFPYAVRSNVGINGRPHSPLTFADIDSTQIDLTDGAYPRGPVGSATADQVHNIGEVWAGMLWEVRARFITRLGAAGNLRFLQFVTDGMKMDPAGPTMTQARDAIIAAANAGGGTAADIDDIWRGFAIRGLGVLASVDNAGTGAGNARVTENYLTPSDPVPSFSISDVTVTEGNVGAKVVNFNVTLANPSASTSTVNYATVDGTATTPSFTFASGGPITIPDSGPAAPYPATVNVAGLVGNVQNVAVRLNSLTHTFPGDLDVLLVGPGGQKAMVLSDVGSTGDVTGINLTLQDGAPPLSATQLVTGTFAPQDIGSGDVMPAPAPVGPYTSPLNVFNGTNPNGTWSLYLLDDAAGDVGTLASFSVIVTTTAAGDYGGGSGQLIFTPGTTTLPVSVQINGDLTPEPNETFRVNLTAPTNAVIGDPLGVGTILNDDNIYVGPGDFDGDGKTDWTVTRTGSIVWHIFNTLGYTGVSFGDHTEDIRVPGDYDGDGKTDIAVWRPSIGTFYVLKSSNGAVIGQQFGQNGDDPRIVGDYDGDGKDDFAVYRPGNPSVWWVMRSSNGTFFGTAFGLTGDKPAPGDYDGDGKFDFAVVRNTGPAGAGTFYIQQSTAGFFAIPWGFYTDAILSGDYDGDGKWDIAVARQVSGAWNHYVRRSYDGSFLGQIWGLATDLLTPGDYDGDNRTDFAVWRPSPAPSTFYVLKTTNGALLAQSWGLNGDFPLMFFIVH